MINVVITFSLPGRGDLQDEDMEADRADALLQHDRCMWEIPL